jgi:hypothetical protein
VRQGHEILSTPLEVVHRDGRLKVLKEIPSTQAEMGEALTLDGIVNTIDAELIAKGTSGKGPERGAVVRHGPFTLWGFAGSPETLTEAGKALFVNTLHYAAKQGGETVLEKRFAKTRCSPYSYLALAKFKNPGFIRTLAQYLPEDMAGKGVAETERWLDENLPYLFAKGRRFQLDLQAKVMGIPNHRRELLDKCIADLGKKSRYLRAYEILQRYTGIEELGASSRAWRKWYEANKDFLFFSDVGGYRFRVDEEAKAKGVPTAELRGWSSETIDYRADPACARLPEDDAKWFLAKAGELRAKNREALAGGLALAVGWITSFTAYPEGSPPLAKAFASLEGAVEKGGALPALLKDPSVVKRILAASYLVCKTRALPHDFVFDALEGDPAVCERALGAMERAGKKD